MKPKEMGCFYEWKGCCIHFDVGELFKDAPLCSELMEKGKCPENAKH